MREFALECLTSSDEVAAIRRRHLERCIGLAERADRLVTPPDRWWEPFEVEWANLLSALSWSVEVGQPGLGLRLGGSMFGYWMLRGQVGDGILWLDRLLTAGSGEPPPYADTPRCRLVVCNGLPVISTSPRHSRPKDSRSAKTQETQSA